MQMALFLDRDGIINVDKDYVYRVEDFEFINGIFELAAAARHQGYLIVVITNQSGIGRGLYTEEDFNHLTRWMTAEFAKREIAIAGVYYCPFHPQAGTGIYKRDSFDRKPNPGMILRARDELDLDLANSALIGDKLSDMEAGQVAGVGRLALISAAIGTAGMQGVAVYPNLVAAREALFD